MDRRKQITKILLFYFLVIFPFGQLFRINLSKFGITIQPIDLVSVVSLFLLTKNDFKSKTFLTVLTLLGFSFLFSFGFFKPIELLPGFMYLIRFLGYFAFYLKLKELFHKENQRKLIKSSLIGVFLITAALGWGQYFLLPDFRSFKVLGWDDHLFRLFGTFLDPGFIGIILVLGFILTLGLYLKNKTKILLFSVIFFGVSVAFTYSRASYLSLILGCFVLTLLNKKIEMFVLILVSFFLLILTLPRPSGEGVKLERIYSIESRIQNYKEGFVIFSKSPVFGIGFNNLCVFKINYLMGNSKASHSCGGLDSSIIYVLSTIGIIGCMILGKLFIQLLKKLNLKDNSQKILLSSIVVIGVHSQFVNSLFYPWVLGYLAILFALDFSRNKVHD